jgi:signal transduction histidine kinase
LWLIVGLGAALVGAAAGVRALGYAWAADVVAFGCFPLIALLRDSAGASASGLAPLVLLPLLWLALYRSKKKVGAGLLVLAASLVAPILLVGGAAYPPAEWRRAALSLVVAGVTAASVRRLVGALRDGALRERERSRAIIERLVEVDRLKDSFIATVSHELRTPLTSIIGYTEMLADGDAGELTPQQAKMIATVRRNSQRLLAQVENLLTASMIEAGGFASRPSRVDVGALIAGVEDALLPAAETASLTMRVDVADDVGAIHADPGQLDRALVNVVSNAIKFSPPGGRVALAARRVSRAVEITVADEGPGIPFEDQPRLFDRFFRTAAAEDRAIPGAGLGLAIVKEIVDSHRGEIELHSTPGVGTQLTLRLPIGRPADEPLPLLSSAAA